MKIIIDVCGCDYPDEMISGVAKVLAREKNVRLVVVGPRADLENALFHPDNADSTDYASRVEIVDSSEEITNYDSPVEAIRAKKNSSLVLAYKRLSVDPECVALISAGNTGAVIAGSILLLGRCKEVERPALSSMLPNDKGGMTCLVDCGANVDCRPEHLLKFAEYGSKFMKSYMDIASPKIGLLSVGAEDKKGDALTKSVNALLRTSDLNFIGNVEGKNALAGDVDVIVCDGFAGNVLLKSVEGTAKSVSARIYSLIKKNAPAETDVKFVDKAFKELFRSLDFNTMGGAVILGVKKIVIKAHGSATAETVVNTVSQAITMYNGGFSDALK